jgi:hypothetical protein
LAWFACDGDTEEIPILLRIAEQLASVLWPSVGSKTLRTPLRQLSIEYHDLIEAPLVKKLTTEYDKTMERLTLWSEQEDFELGFDYGRLGLHFLGTEAYELRIWADRKTQECHGLVIFKSLDDAEGPFGHVHGGLLVTKEKKDRFFFFFFFF